MFKACIMLGIATAVVVGELVGWSAGLGPLVVAKAVMLAALVGFNCLKLGDSTSSPPSKPLRTHWAKADLPTVRSHHADYDPGHGIERKNLVA